MIRALNLFRKNVYQFSYSKAMYEAWKSDPSAVHEHWDVVFSSPSKGGELSPEIERQKDLALSAYMFIRCYKQRGHELADLDPLHLVDFKEFGKKYVKQGMENELKKLK
jgi:2-oxoglutarate dehydrogenase complex dehydrogenase (E1) component-like enzyme